MLVARAWLRPPRDPDVPAELSVLFMTRRSLAIRLLDAAVQTVAHSLVWAWFRLCRVRST